MSLHYTPKNSFTSVWTDPFIKVSQVSTGSCIHCPYSTVSCSFSNVFFILFFSCYQFWISRLPGVAVVLELLAKNTSKGPKLITVLNQPWNAVYNRRILLLTLYRIIHRPVRYVTFDKENMLLRSPNIKCYYMHLCTILLIFIEPFSTYSLVA